MTYCLLQQILTRIAFVAYKGTVFMQEIPGMVERIRNLFSQLTKNRHFSNFFLRLIHKSR